MQPTAPVALAEVTLTPALKAPRECERALKSNSRTVNLALLLPHSVSPAQELISLCLSFLLCKMGLIITKSFEDEISKNQQHAEGPCKSGRALSHRLYLVTSTHGGSSLGLVLLGWRSRRKARVAATVSPRDRVGPGGGMGWGGVTDGVQVWWEQERPMKWLLLQKVTPPAEEEVAQRGQGGGLWGEARRGLGPRLRRLHGSWLRGPVGH